MQVGATVEAAVNLTMQQLVIKLLETKDDDVTLRTYMYACRVYRPV